MSDNQLLFLAASTMHIPSATLLGDQAGSSIWEAYSNQKPSWSNQTGLHTRTESEGSTQTLQKEPDAPQLCPHALQAQPFPTEAAAQDLQCSRNRKNNKGRKKPAALWATILANNNRLGGPDNSH